MKAIFQVLRKIFNIKEENKKNIAGSNSDIISETTASSNLSEVQWDELEEDNNYEVRYLCNSDLRIVVGNKVLILAFDRCEAGLHNGEYMIIVAYQMPRVTR